MRYLYSPLILILAILLGLAAIAAPARRPAGKQSSLSSVRKRQKIELKPLVYSAKRNRPVMAKKPRWWQKR